MIKYHINGRGEAGPCSAQLGNCPFGAEDRHFPSKATAQQAYEIFMAEGQKLPTINKKKSQSLASTIAQGEKVWRIALESAREDIGDDFTDDMAYDIFGSMHYEMTTPVALELARREFGYIPDGLAERAKAEQVEAKRAKRAALQAKAVQEEENRKLGIQKSALTRALNEVKEVEQARQETFEATCKRCFTIHPPGTCVYDD